MDDKRVARLAALCRLELQAAARHLNECVAAEIAGLFAVEQIKQEEGELRAGLLGRKTGAVTQAWVLELEAQERALVRSSLDAVAVRLVGAQATTDRQRCDSELSRKGLQAAQGKLRAVRARQTPRSGN
ncbi:MAG: hypothetical protein MUC50_21690 [Myxococcota bacterium]|jgi:hypothetical protein|nr:hypothetical protein [Myxococcota bacterium]